MNKESISPQLMLDQIFIASIDTAIAIIDKDYRLCYLNPTAENFFSIKSEQILGKTIRELHINSSHSNHHFVQAVAKIKDGENFEYLLEQPGNQKTRYLGMRLSGLWEEKELVGYLLLATDITHRHQTELHLKAEEKQFRSLYEQAPSPYQSIDTEGCIRFINRAWLSLLGYTEQQVLGRPLAELVIEPQRKNFIKNLNFCTSW